MKSLSQSQNSTVSIASSANTTYQFSVGDGVASAAQKQLTNISNTFITPPAGQPAPTFDQLIFAADGSLSNPPSAPALGAGRAYLYLSGAVTGTGGSVVLPAASTTGGNGFSGIFANIAGSETITGGAGKNQLLVTSAQTNLTWDPQGGSFTDSIIAGGGNNNFTLDGTHYDVLASAGSNTITAAQNVVGASNSYNFVTTTGGDNRINLDAGQNYISSGGNDTINVANSSNYITTSGAADVIFASAAGGNSLVAGGTTTVHDHGSNDAVTLEGSASLINGGSNNHVTVSGGKQDFVTGDSNTVSASTTVTPVALFGQNNSLVGGGGGVLYAYGSGNIVNAAGADTVMLNGQGNTVTDLNGNGVVFAGSEPGATAANSVSAGGSVIVVAGGSGTMDAATLQGGATELALGSTTIDATGSNNVLLTGGDNVATIGASAIAVAYTGANTIDAAGGGTVYNNGNLTFVATGGGTAVIQQGGGSVTAHGGVGSLRAFGGSAGNNLLVGGSGGSTLFGGGGGDTLEGGSGNNLLVGGPGAATMVGGANATLNTFAFASPLDSGSTDLIANFRTGTDKIELLAGTGVSQQQVVGGALSITLTDGTRLTLQGVTSTLTASGSGPTTILG